MAEVNKEYLEGLCKWLKETKGITEIDVFELAGFQPEYDEYLSGLEKDWTSGYVKCDLCTHEWIAVYNIRSEKLECPCCHIMVNFEIIQEFSK